MLSRGDDVIESLAITDDDLPIKPLDAHDDDAAARIVSPEHEFFAHYVFPFMLASDICSYDIIEPLATADDLLIKPLDAADVSL